MALFLRSKTCLQSRLKSLSTLLRFNHTLTEYTQLPPEMGSYDFASQQNSIIDFSKWKKINAKSVGVTRSKIPPSPWIVLKILHDKGFEAYLVGGCVRDLLLNRIPKDFDVITTAKLKQVKKQFRRCEIVGRRFPICMVHIKGSVVEVSSFETVAKHAEEKEKFLLSQMPSSCDEKDFIRWRNSMHRDFTINSLFFDPFMDKIYDYANGIADLRSFKLRTLIPAPLSFKEDCARILRGLRIAGRLGLSISRETTLAIRELSSSLKNLNKGRIMMELNYMLSYGAAETTICLLRRFNLLELFFPFHAAYFNQQAAEKSQSPMMLMKLFFNLDKVVGCDRPCDYTLWVGLLAFHQALVSDPQDALVIWVFASVLYHGSWKEGVKFAREGAKPQYKFAPEMSGFSEFKSDEELAKEVSHLAALVRHSIGALVNLDILAQSMLQFPVSAYSDLVFVSRNAGSYVSQLFDELVDDVESFERGRKSFMIDYYLLGKGNLHETRCVLGQVILETLSGGLAKEGMEVAEEKCDLELSDMVKHQIDIWKDKKRILSRSDSEQMQERDKKQKLVMTKSISEPEVDIKKEVRVVKNESKEMAKKHQKVVDTSELSEGELNMIKGNILGKKKHHMQRQESDKKNKTFREEKCQEKIREPVNHNQLNVSGSSNVGSDKNIKRKEKIDRHALLPEVINGKTEKVKSGRTLLSELFKQ
ncbi:uncharacterized protein LOC105628553 [Jatropha curcas]|uniref:uncharacterized protein LOC105628553 n=1 Tax=Jatropha curcas TaxID=180498 RepID=UPI0005FB1024|nr:uncharacterized protein LOC105628553 [Jatropha curcas]